MQRYAEEDNARGAHALVYNDPWLGMLRIIFLRMPY